MHADLAAIQSHPETAAPCWFNHLLTFAPTAHTVGLPVAMAYRVVGSALAGVRFADDRPITHETVNTISDTIRECQGLVRWEAGDVLILDNYRTLHGRMPYRGRREVQAAMLR